MEEEHSKRAFRWTQIIALTGATGAATIGALAIAGWNIGSEALMLVQSGFIPVQYNTALAFLSCSLSLLALVVERRLLATVAAAFAALLAAGNAVEYVAAVDLHVSTVFFTGIVSDHINGQMAPNTVFAFACVCVALLLLAGRRRIARATEMAVSLAALVLAVAAVALTGYIAKIPSAYQWRGKTPIAVLTTIGFLALACAIIATACRCSADRRRVIPRWLPTPAFVFLMALCGMIAKSMWDASRIAILPQPRRSLVFSTVMIVVFGTMVSTAFMIVIRMMQSAHRRSRELEMLNRELDAESERRQLQAVQLEDERRRFHDVLNALPAYVILIAPDYTIPFANHYFEERFGRSEGRRCYEYLFHREQPCDTCESFRVLETGTPHRWEWLGPDERDYDIRDFLFTDTRGRSLILETGTDITDRKRAEAELEQLNRALRLVSAASHAIAHASHEQELLQELCDLAVSTGGYRLAWVGLAVDDAAKTVRVAAKAGEGSDYLNDTMVTWAEDAKGRGPTGTAIRTGQPARCDDVTQDPMFLPWRDRALQFGFRSTLVLPLLREGRAFGGFALYAVEPNAFHAEEQALFLQLVEDLTFGLETLRTREARQRAEQRIRLLAAMVDSSDDAIYAKTLAGAILTWNRGAERLYGYTESEAIGQDIALLAPPDRHGEGAELLARLRHGNKVDHFETVRRHRDGHLIDVSLTLSLIRDDRGLPLGACSIARDITERRQAQQELERFAVELQRSNSELQEFAFVASHDLQEPLRKIIAFSERLRDRAAGQLDETSLDYLNRMHNAAARMGSLINSLLEYSRVATRELPFEEVDLAALMLDVLADLEQRTHESGAHILLQTLPIVHGDPTQLRQLFQNLLANALKFHAPDTPPEIRVQCEEHDGRWRVSVSDNGIGFEPQYAEKIFRPFQRLHGRNEYEGSGMGLAICRKIAQRHGAAIEVTSAPGHGATFSVSLPAAPEASGERTEPCPRFQSASSSQKTMMTTTC